VSRRSFTTEPASRAQAAAFSANFKTVASRLVASVNVRIVDAATATEEAEALAEVVFGEDPAAAVTPARDVATTTAISNRIGLSRVAALTWFDYPLRRAITFLSAAPLAQFAKFADLLPKVTIEGESSC
jgi:hypothetical protein